MNENLSKNLITTYQRFAAPLPNPGDKEYQFLLEELSLASTLILPEYFAFHEKLKPGEKIAASNEALAWLQRLSLTPESQDTLLFGGSVIEKIEGALHNSVPLFFNGKLIARYFKRRLYKTENDYLKAGHGPLIITHPATGEKWGVLICADVYLPEVFEEYKEAGHIAIPTASPFLKDDTPEAQMRRDHEIYLQGARRAGAMIHKSCVSGFLSSESRPNSHVRVQGRSLIVSPEAILLKAPHIEWSGVLRHDPLKKSCSLQEFLK